jgi:mevalonate kinase
LKFLTKTPGKLIILGEYAVLEGAPSLVASTNRFANAFFKKSTDGIFKIEAPSINVPLLKFLIDNDGKVRFIEKPFNKVVEKLSLFTAIFEHAAHKLIEKGIKIPPLEIMLDTYDFYLPKNLLKLGLGSSAAVTVSIITGLLSANIIEPDEISPEQILKLAMDSHKTAQGSIGSGVDIVAAVYGGIIKYQIKGKEINFKQIPFPKDLYYLTVWSGKPASTPGYVEKFNKFKKERIDDFDNLVKEMTLVSSNGIDAFENGELTTFLDNYDKYFHLLNRLNTELGIPVITKEHQQIYDIARANDTYYKSSGAGGGDLGILFATEQFVVNKVNAELKKQGFDTLEIKFGTQGINSITNDGEVNAEFSYS